MELSKQRFSAVQMISIFGAEPGTFFCIVSLLMKKMKSQLFINGSSFAVLLTTLTAVWPNLALAHSEDPTCGGKIVAEGVKSPQPLQLTISHYDTCYFVALDLLQVAERSNYNLDSMQVLVLTNFGSWNYHVVVQMGDVVYDAASDRKQLVAPRDLKAYLASGKRFDSLVRIIPAREYLKKLSEDKDSSFFQNGIFNYAGYSSGRYQTLPISLFIKELK